MTSKLALFNTALRFCGERKLASLSENREPRRLLDDVFSAQGVEYCLEAGLWNFAMRTVKLTYDSAITPAFGFRRVFAKPDDFVRTAAVSSDEYFKNPLLEYTDEAAYLFADLDDIYVKYISDHADYGLDYSLWPPSFFNFASAHFASQIVGKLTQDKERIKMVHAALEFWRTEAKAKDAMAEPTKFAPSGSWSASRRGRWGGRSDGGNRGSLIG